MKYEEIVAIVKSVIIKYSLKEFLWGSYEDMVQTFLCKVYEKLPYYDENKSSITTFIYVVVLGVYRMELRKYRAEKHKAGYNQLSLEDVISADGELTLRDTIADDYDMVQELENKQLLEECYKLLCLESKLYYFEELNQTEIADRLNESQTNVSRKIKKNMKDIREFILYNKKSNRLKKGLQVEIPMQF